MRHFFLFGDSVQRQKILNSLLFLFFSSQNPGVPRTVIGAVFIVQAEGLGHVSGALTPVVRRDAMS